MPRCLHVLLGDAGEVRDLFRLHDIQGLGADLAGLAEALWVPAVVLTPVVAVAVGAPLLVEVKEGEVVGLGLHELLALRVALLLIPARAEENRWDGEH